MLPLSGWTDGPTSVSSRQFCNLLMFVADGMPLYSLTQPGEGGEFIFYAQNYKMPSQELIEPWLWAIR